MDGWIKRWEDEAYFSGSVNESRSVNDKTVKSVSWRGKVLLLEFLDKRSIVAVWTRDLLDPIEIRQKLCPSTSYIWAFDFKF